jgi:hypothetical protein
VQALVALPTPTIAPRLNMNVGISRDVYINNRIEKIFVYFIK